MLIKEAMAVPRNEIQGSVRYSTRVKQRERSSSKESVCIHHSRSSEGENKKIDLRISQLSKEVMVIYTM